MPSVASAMLLVVVALGVIAVLARGFFPRFRLPAIVLEIWAGDPP